jgi:predicted SprT family Zn-dependent metalloprotease
VRMLLPPIDQRREMDKNLVVFFRGHGRIAFRRAIADFCRYYHLRRPQIEWYEYIDWGKTAGKTFEDGRIHLVHPENWKRGRIYKSERMWVQMVYHELAHYLFWTDAETKAEAFTCRMVRGLRRTPRRTHSVAARGVKRTTRITRVSSTRRSSTNRGARRGTRQSRTSLSGARRSAASATGVRNARTISRPRRRKVTARTNRRITRRARG